MLRAPDDALLLSPEYQKEVRQFLESLQETGVEFGVGIELIEAAAAPPDGGAWYSGIFTLKALAISAAPTITGLLGAWLRGRSKRKVRVSIGGGRLSAEAQTAKEVEGLLNKAVEYQRTMREIEKTARKKSPTKKKSATVKPPRNPR